MAVEMDERVSDTGAGHDQGLPWRAGLVGFPCIRTICIIPLPEMS